MSVQAITWALGKAPTIAAQAVLFGLANHADEWGITFVGRDTLAEECSCRAATVTSNMKALEDAGLIARFQRRHGGRRTSDIVVLAPRNRDRGAMRDADRRAASMYADEVVEAAQGAPSEPSLDGSQGAPHVSQGALGVPEPSEEPSGEPTTTTTGARASIVLWLDVPAEMRADAAELLKRRTKVGPLVVREPEMAIAAAALAEFNRQAGADYGLGANMRSIVMRIRERPSADAAAHVRLVQSAWRVRWWERNGNGRKPAPNVIYGEKAFEMVWQDAVAEARGETVQAPAGERLYFGGRRWSELSTAEQYSARQMINMGRDPK